MPCPTWSFDLFCEYCDTKISVGFFPDDRVITDDEREKPDSNNRGGQF